jgi:hypothetical protein
MGRTFASAAAVALVSLALAHPAAAIPACKDGVSGAGRAPLRLNSATGKAIAQKEAERRAISAWAKEVRSRCGTHSPYWWRATSKKVACQTRSGGAVCNVTAVPAKKVLKGN